MTRPPLTCELAGEPVAEVIDAGAGQYALRYLDHVVADRTGQRLLSVRLPVRAQTYASQQGAQVFLDGLLAEDWVRGQLAQRAHLDPEDTFGLLRRYGGDCAGAVTFRDADTPDVPAGVRWLDDDELVAVLRDLRSLPLGDSTDETVRLSLGGVQEKLIAVLDGDRVGIPIGSRRRSTSDHRRRRRRRVAGRRRSGDAPRCYRCYRADRAGRELPRGAGPRARRGLNTRGPRITGVSRRLPPRPTRRPRPR